MVEEEKIRDIDFIYCYGKIKAIKEKMQELRKLFLEIANEDKKGDIKSFIDCKYCLFALLAINKDLKELKSYLGEKNYNRRLFDCLIKECFL